MNLTKIPLFFFISYPFLWVLGIDQLFVSFFILIISALAPKNALLIKKNTFVVTFLIISTTSFLAIPYIENWGLWLKGTVTFFSLVIYYNLLISIKSRAKLLENISNSLFYCSIFVALSVFLFTIFGEMRFETVLAPIFPSGSYFFDSMKVHSLGATFSEFSTTEKLRFSGPFVSYSSMSMATLLLIPSCLIYKGPLKLLKAPVSLLLVIGLFSTESRLAIIAFLVFFVIVLYKQKSFFSKKIDNVLKLIYITIGITLFAVLFMYIEIIYFKFYDLFFGERAASAFTRMKIYSASLEGFFDKPFTGWGHSRPLDMSSKRFSAGTHSSYVALGYQNGAFALLAYIIFISLAVKKIFIVLRSKIRGAASVIMAAGLLSFLIREAADIWWWDSLLLIIFVNYYFLFENRIDYYEKTRTKNL